VEILEPLQGMALRRRFGASRAKAEAVGERVKLFAGQMSRRESRLTRGAARRFPSSPPILNCKNYQGESHPYGVLSSRKRYSIVFSAESSSPPFKYKACIKGSFLVQKSSKIVGFDDF